MHAARAWFRSLWASFLASYDPEEGAAATSPRVILLAAMALIAVFLSVAYLPGISEAAELRRPWPSVILVLAGASISYVAFSQRCRGLWGSLASLIDNGFYAASLAWAAVTSALGFGLAFAVMLGLMLLSFQGPAYGLTLLMALVIVAPTLLIVVTVEPTWMVATALIAASAVGLGRMALTRRGRARTPQSDRDRSHPEPVWPRSLWASFLASYDPEVATAHSTPRGIFIAVAAIAGAMLTVGYLPGVAESAQLRAPWVSVALVVLGGMVTWFGWRRGCTGRWGSLAALLDNGLYVGSFMWAAANSSRPYGLFFAGVIGAALVGFQGSLFGLSFLLAAVIVGPTLVIALVSDPDPLVSLALVVACAVALVRLEINTGLRQRRAAAEERRGLTITADSGTKYRLGALVGAGGMGAVYRALTLSGKVVAVKRLHPHWFDSARQKKALLREALIVNSLEHQGVVRVIDHGGLDTESPYLVMELLEGKTLRQRAEQSGERLPWRDAAHIAERVLDVLAAAHARGIVHCDVKPSNIFLCDDGKAKLLDFGISRPPEELLDATLSVHIAGTPACMAPEQIFDPRGVDPRTDLWSLGATLFWSITGEWPRVLPEPCPSLAEAAKLPARSIRDLSPTLPEDLALTIDVALRLDRDARWPSARAMQAWLLRVLGSEVKEPLQPPPPLRAVADAPAEA